MNKLLLTLVGLILISSAHAAPLCREILLKSPSVEAVDATWQALSNLKYQLDLAQVKNSDEFGIGLLKSEFKTKLLELQSRLGLDNASLRIEITKRISKIQESKRSENEKIIQNNSEVHASLQPFQLERQVPMTRFLKSDAFAYLENFISRNGERLFGINHDGVEVTNLLTGQAEFLAFKYSPHLSGSTFRLLLPEAEILLQVKARDTSGFITYALEAIDLKNSFAVVAGPDKALTANLNLSATQMRRGADQKSFILHDRKNYLVLDAANLKLIASGKLPDELVPRSDETLASLNYLPDGSLLALYNLDLYRYQPKTNELTVLYRGSRKNLPDVKMIDSEFLAISDWDFIQTLSLKTQKTSYSRFGGSIASIVPADPGFIWVAQNGKGKPLHRVSLTDLNQEQIKFPEELPHEGYFFIRDLPQSNNIEIVHSLDGRNKVDLYDRANLGPLNFRFENRYDADETAFAHTRYSEDGSMAVFIIRSRNSPMRIDIWRKR